ncbi:YadA domain-containing protein [Actinobacillus indolicus]|nr:YadA domain-containing protein [Actinobacillus indolicus]VTU06691.1 YadA domain-containing protein [Actinobacillus indolicus]
MNKVYMVKRNALGQSVVCSEKTKARGKVKSIALAVAAASAMLASVDAVAATATGTGTTGTVGNVVLDGDTAGNLAITSTGTATATGGNSIAIGHNVTAEGAHTTAMGENLFVSDKIKNATVIGRDMSFGGNEEGMAVDGLTVVGNQNIIEGAVGGEPLLHHVAFFGDNNFIGGSPDGTNAANLTIVGSFSGVGGSFSAERVSNAAILGTGSTFIPDGNTSGNYMLIAGHNSSIALDDMWSGVTENVTVIGHHSKIDRNLFNTGESVDNTTIIGNNNDVGTTNTLVLGNNVTQTIGMDVVLGNDSASYESGTATAGRADYPSYTIKDTTYNFAGTTPHNIISVGATGKEGRIQNVASGLISSTSTDAINGSQLYAVTEALKAIQTINPDDIADVITTEVNVTGGDNVQVNREGNNFTISATDTNTQSSSSVVDGKGLAVTATDNANGTKNYAFETKIGDGLVFGDNGEIKATGTTLTAGDNITVEGDATNGYTIKATDTNTQSSASVVDGKGLTVTATDNANGTKNYAFETKIGDGLVFGDNGEIKATGTALTAGDNITVEGDATSGYTIKATNTQSVVKAGNGVTVDVADNDIGTKDYTVSTKIGDGLTFGDNGEIKATGTIINAGDNITVTGDAINGYTISTKGGVTDEQLQDVINQINGIVDTNTQSTTSAGQGIVITETDNANGTKNYAVSIKATDGLTFDDNGNIKVSDTLVKAGDNVQVSGNAKDGFTVSAKGTEITAGDNVNVSGDAKNGYTISVDNMRTTVTGGQGAEVASSDNTDGSKNYTVNVKVGEGLTYDDKGNVVNDMKLTAGDNVQVSGNAKDGFTVSAKGTEITAGDNVNVSGDANNGYTISVENMRTTVTGGQGAEVTSLDNIDGSKNYTVNVKVGEGLTYDDKGNVVNDMKLTAGNNVQVSGDAKGGYTISATDTNTQATVSADQGITITETDNANGTKNYAVSAKLGKGLKMDENGAIAATAQPINGGAGVTITTNAQDESVVNVAGVTTTTDDGKSYTRSDLTKSVGVKGDGKNIRTSTTANGDVQVKLADDVKVNSITTGNVSISTKGVNAGGKKVTNVAPAEISPTSTDAVNGSQLHATNIQVHNNTQNIAKLGDRVNHLDTKVNKVNKEARAGIAGTVATASLPQVYMAGKSMVSAAAGHYKNENAVAVGYSRASDNGKLVFKLNSSANTRGDFTIGTGIGYQW